MLLSPEYGSGSALPSAHLRPSACVAQCARAPGGASVCPRFHPSACLAIGPYGLTGGPWAGVSPGWDSSSWNQSFQLWKLMISAALNSAPAGESWACSSLLLKGLLKE